jgi:endonuclease YncB( thermonuclease family)
LCNLYSITTNQSAVASWFRIKGFEIGAMLAVLILGPTLAALADDLIGQASIIDADTLEIRGSRIRLWGIDAPESTQLCRGADSERYRCGAKAANNLDAFIASRPVNCLPINLDRYGRTVATCAVGGVDLGEWLVQNGLALDWPQYSKGKWRATEAGQRELNAMDAAKAASLATQPMPPLPPTFRLPGSGAAL